MKYNFGKGLWKSVVSAVIFGFPLFVTGLESMPQTSQYLDLTLGGVLALVVNYLKVKHKQSK